MKSNLRSAVRACERRLGKWVTKAYAAGPELEDAVRMCHEFRQRGMASDVCYWANDDQAPRRVADAYISAIRAVANEGLDSLVSVKAMVLGFDRTLVSEVMDAARDGGVGLYLDSRALEFTDRLLALVAEYAPLNPVIGCAIPGRWQRSPDDAERVSGYGARVRVVKGQWVDPDHPDIDLRHGFMAVIDRLAGRARHVAVATHDAPLARQALRRLLDAGTPCELELLFGLPMRVVTQVARELNVSVRVYIPYGRSWVPYAIRRVVRNPRMLWWMLADSTFGRWAQFLK